MVDPKRFDELNEALALLFFGFRKVTEEPDRVLAQHGFSRVHHRILFFVARRPGRSVGDLLVTLAISKQALHRPMQELIAAGLLEANPSEENKRVKRLVLTKAGVSLEERLSGIQRKSFDRAFRGAGKAAEEGWRWVMRDLGGVR